MTSYVSNQSERRFYLLDNWVTQRELSLPLDTTHALTSQDYFPPRTKVALWERILFRIYTGLDLQRVRDLKEAYSPRFKQLMTIAASNQDPEIRAKAHAASELIRLKAGLQAGTLEAYWVDRELSVHIKNFKVLEETLENLRLTECQGISNHPQCTDYKLLTTDPIESTFSDRIHSRLWNPRLSSKYEVDYDEKTDTFKVILWENSIYRKLPVFEAIAVINNWVNIRLTKVLQEDIERRNQDPDCRLLFAYSEIYEDLLRRRHQMALTARWVTGAALVSLAGIALLFFKIRKQACQL